MATEQSNAALEFTCTREIDKVPPASAEAEKLFQQARAAERASGIKDFNSVAKLYAQAGKLGHWKALQNLQVMYYEGLVEHPNAPAQVIELNEQLIKLGAPIGYYNLATYLEQGYGVKQDKDAALVYYRKSADFGSPNGQNHVGRLLSFKLKKPEIGNKMLECAVNQGFGQAAKNLEAYFLVIKEDHVEALKWLQKAAGLGHEMAASLLKDTFKIGPEAISYYKNIVDPERAIRYEMIEKEIKRNPSSRFPDIDKIVPLPPAALPQWDGRFEYKNQKS